MRTKGHKLIADEGAFEFSSTSIFITPMLDMCFQVLAFFILTYSPADLEGQFPISLAAGDPGGERRADKPLDATTPELTQVKPAVTVTAKMNHLGHLNALEIMVAGSQQTIKGQEGHDMPVDQLISELSRQLRDIKTKSRLDDRMTFRAHFGLRWDDAMKVMDACRQTKDPKTGSIIELFPKLDMAFVRKS
jgi:biopolymer transport protein ExbD